MNKKKVKAGTPAPKKKVAKKKVARKQAPMKMVTATAHTRMRNGYEARIAELELLYMSSRQELDDVVERYGDSLIKQQERIGAIAAHNENLKAALQAATSCSSALMLCFD